MSTDMLLDLAGCNFRHAQLVLGSWRPGITCTIVEDGHIAKVSGRQAPRHKSEATTSKFYTSVLPEVARAAAEKTALIIPRASVRRLGRG